MTIREEVRRLVDGLPENELEAAKRYLEFPRYTSDPVLRSLMTAPVDDEPDTDEERAAAAEAWGEYRRGEVISSERARRDLLS